MIIYIVEDDENISEIVSYCLKGAGFEVKCFKKAGDFLNALFEKKPDLCILDIMLPGINGIDILKTIRNNMENHEIPVIMLTAKSDEFSKIKAFDDGADDYITKPFGVMELVSRVKALLRRSQKNNKVERYCKDDIVIDMNEMRVFKNGNAVELTNKEFALLKCLFENQKNVLSRMRLLELVWGYDYNGETRTVDMHIKSLRKKLSGEVIETIRGVGYRLKR